MAIVEQIQAAMAEQLPGHLGTVLDSATPDCVTGHLKIDEHHCTSGHIAHGGTVMALADTLGAVGAFLNLDPGQRTTTVESKTNFLAPTPMGDTLSAESRLVNRGRRLMLWQTELRRGDGRLVAVVSQSQMVLSD